MARFRSRSPARRLLWEASGRFGVNSVAMGESGAIGLVTNAQLEALGNPTITRMRGWLRMALGGTISDSVLTAIWACFGIQLVDDNLITLGDISVSATQEDSWMWYSMGVCSTHASHDVRFNSSGTETGTSTKYDTQIEGRQFFDIDCKAMRKVPRGKKLILAYTVNTLSGSPPGDGLRLDGYVRTLFKE